MQSSHREPGAAPEDNVDLMASLAANAGTGDATGAVKLIKGKSSATSCHNPHVQAKDLISQNFLVKAHSSSGQLSCPATIHKANSGQVNPLSRLVFSAHALSTGKIAPRRLSELHHGRHSCLHSCHTPHNASGAARLLRGQNEQDCIACHNGSNISRWRLTPTVFSEYATLKSDIHSPLRLIPTMPLRAYCSTTTAMLLAWTAIMPMGPKWSGHFLFRR